MPRISDMLPSTSCTPTSGMWEAMPSDVQALLEDIAGNVRILLGRVQADAAFDEIESYRLTVEEEAALWTRFDSSERTVLRAVRHARRQREET